MSGSLTRGCEENVPGIPGACATRNLIYLVRGLCLSCMYGMKEGNLVIACVCSVHRNARYNVINYHTISYHNCAIPHTMRLAVMLPRFLLVLWTLQRLHMSGIGLKLPATQLLKLVFGASKNWLTYSDGTNHEPGLNMDNKEIKTRYKPGGTHEITRTP